MANDNVMRVKAKGHGALKRSDAGPLEIRAIAASAALRHECLELMHRRGK
jgi:hypothetical protein